MKSLNLDSFKNPVCTFKTFLTVSKCLNSVDSLIWLTVNKFLAVAKPSPDSQTILYSQEILYSFKTQLSKVQNRVDMASNMRLNLDNFQKPKSQQIQKQFSTVNKFLTDSKLLVSTVSIPSSLNFWHGLYRESQSWQL